VIQIHGEELNNNEIFEQSLLLRINLSDTGIASCIVFFGEWKGRKEKEKG
jgi:hypothetical protein